VPKLARFINHRHCALCVPITGQDAQHIDTRAQHCSDHYWAFTNEQTWPTVRPKCITIAYLLIRGKVRMVGV
jgi:hypothetical protein